jgi:hypothetical protein
MSAQTCPKCGNRGFTWYIDAADSPLTQWFCSVCGYSGEEDESRLSTCPACDMANMLFLSDQDGPYWFCLHCRRLNFATNSG